MEFLPSIGGPKPLSRPPPRSGEGGKTAFPLRFGEGSRQAEDRFAVIDEMRPIRSVDPCGILGDAQTLIDCRRHVFRRLRVGLGVAAGLIGRADDGAAANPAAREEYGLHRSPM